MSFTDDLRHTPSPPGSGDDPLSNLSAVQARMDSLQKFLSDSVNSNTLLGQRQMDMVSHEITSAIHQIFVNGAALLSATTHHHPPPPPPQKPAAEEVNPLADGGDCEIIELDAVELLAEHIHFCDYCGKGFKRDANLRMHMRAHGNQYKTPEALAKPDNNNKKNCNNLLSVPSGAGAGAGAAPGAGLIKRFSCPFKGCPRNKAHAKFRPLKSAICVKNHFKRSHCPKMYACTRCNKKSFSVLADLKSHLKHCGDTKWKCSCGTSFSRKDKLFGHMALFEGHMPAVEEEEVEEETVAKDVEVECSGGSDNGFLDRLMLDGMESIDAYCFQDLLEFSSPAAENVGWFS